MRGRKPVPTYLKLLRGNPGRRPVNDREPHPDPVLLSPPEDLSELGRKEWDRIARELFELGMLTNLDRAGFEAYCHAYARWQEAKAQVKKLGMIIKTKKGNIIQNPYLAVENKAMEQMKSFMVELGLSLSSRSRVKIGKKKPIDPLSEFQNRRQHREA